MLYVGIIKTKIKLIMLREKYNLKFRGWMNATIEIQNGIVFFSLNYILSANTLQICFKQLLQHINLMREREREIERERERE